MGIPWLYSVGFSITFGALFAKIRFVHNRVQTDTQQAAVDDTVRHVSARQTALTVGLVLSIDIVILTVWSIVDPLEWKRTILTADKYGEPLTSSGHCSSDHWLVFGGIIASFHFCLIAVASYKCYVTKEVHSAFTDVKYIAIAMFSNMQVFVLGLPVLMILGAESAGSFFVRCAFIWLNDFVVVTLIFGHLMYSVHMKTALPSASPEQLGPNNNAVEKPSVDIGLEQ
jgi:hypothetical protein